MTKEESTNWPKRLGKWNIKRRLASRVDNLVLLGESKGELAAIKVVKNVDLLEERDRIRFDKEVLNLQRMDHPAIPKIIDLDLTNAMQPWIATEYISGPTLQEKVSDTPLNVDEWLKALSEITDALAYVHSLGVYHRDVSPSNIILSDAGANLIDFGLSYLEDSQTLTKTGVGVQGTPGTVSPESLLFKRDPKMDMFSLGCTFIFAATGKFPFEIEDQESLLVNRVVYESPNFWNMNDKMKTILTPLLYKNLSDRVDSATFLSLKLNIFSKYK